MAAKSQDVDQIQISFSSWFQVAGQCIIEVPIFKSLSTGSDLGTSWMLSLYAQGWLASGISTTEGSSFQVET